MYINVEKASQLSHTIYHFVELDIRSKGKNIFSTLEKNYLSRIRYLTKLEKVSIFHLLFY